eukprot:TRINITY_DN5679_c0_g1_i2.p1 TRINITY_DN5679_c0_g1~~TRINITY_DN5679_c0_g1_i2.p1  ORF type:complete len:316 (+),score=98.99 TRINITY_DN5679_c0_g1_i2:71-949(+)
MAEGERRVSFFVPLHCNVAQLEHTAPFIADQRATATLFVYKWNTAGDAMRRHFEQDAAISSSSDRRLTLLEFSIEAVVDQLRRAAAAKQRVVVLLTASTNYSFGGRQRQFFESLRGMFAGVIVDVFAVGHCMFGCQSCGIREHNYPIFFTRFINNQLPYSTSDVRGQLESKRAAQFSAIAAAVRPSFSVLIAPSVGPLSFLSNPLIIDALIDAKQFMPEIVWLVKLHGFVWLDDKHPLSSISGLERQQAARLAAAFGGAADQEHGNILPYLDACDVVCTPSPLSSCPWPDVV